MGVVAAKVIGTGARATGAASGPARPANSPGTAWLTRTTGPTAAIPAQLVADIIADATQQRVGAAGGTGSDGSGIATIGPRTTRLWTASFRTASPRTTNARAITTVAAVSFGRLTSDDSLATGEASPAGGGVPGGAVADIEQVSRRGSVAARGGGRRDTRGVGATDRGAARAITPCGCIGEGKLRASGIAWTCVGAASLAGGGTSGGGPQLVPQHTRWSAISTAACFGGGLCTLSGAIARVARPRTGTSRGSRSGRNGPGWAAAPRCAGTGDRVTGQAISDTGSPGPTAGSIHPGV